MPSLAVAAGLACAVALAKTFPAGFDPMTAFSGPLCSESTGAASGSSKVGVISSHALPNVPGKCVTVVRVTYGRGGFTPAHRHGGSVTAYITKGEIRS